MSPLTTEILDSLVVVHWGLTVLGVLKDIEGNENFSIWVLRTFLPCYRIHIDSPPHFLFTTSDKWRIERIKRAGTAIIFPYMVFIVFYLFIWCINWFETESKSKHTTRNNTINNKKVGRNNTNRGGGGGGSGLFTSSYLAILLWVVLWCQLWGCIAIIVCNFFYYLITKGLLAKPNFNCSLEFHWNFT